MFNFFFIFEFLLDIDECINGQSMCSDNATCTNTEGSYTCMCESGFAGDGYNCSGG